MKVRLQWNPVWLGKGRFAGPGENHLKSGALGTPLASPEPPESLGFAEKETSWRFGVVFVSFCQIREQLSPSRERISQQPKPKGHEEGASGLGVVTQEHRSAQVLRKGLCRGGG